MRFAFTDDQLAFRDAVRELLGAECPPAVVRQAWAGGTGRSPRLWAKLGEMGVLSILAPESSGGLGLTDVDLVLLLEETGYAGLPDPVVESAAVAVPLLSALGESALVEEVASGMTVATVCGLGPGTGVVHADADLVIRVDGDSVAIAEPAEAVLRDTVDGARRVFEVTDWSGVRPLGVHGDAVADAFDRAAVAVAAQLVGLARRCLDLTVGYVKERQQFGVPIGSFPGVKHQLATSLMRLEFARPAVYRAANSIATGAPDRSRDASMAKALAGDAAALVGRTALQCHGAIGYTVEYDLHLFLKRIQALSASWGDAAWHRRRVAVALRL